MPQLTDRNSGKKFEVIDIAALSASISGDANSKHNNRIHDRIGIDKVPSRLKDSQNQGKFVDLRLVNTGSGAGIFRDIERGIVYVPFTKKNFQQMTIGDTRDGNGNGQLSEISKSFSATAYRQISASFARTFGNVSSDTNIIMAVEEFYTASSGQVGSFVGPVTASMNTFTPSFFEINGVTSSFSGIDTGNGYDMTFDFSDSSFVTNQLIVFPIGGEANTLRTSTFIPTFQHRFIHSGSNRTNKALITSSLASINGILGLDATAVSPPSGSDCGVGTLININGTNANAGTYSQNTFKGRVAGDADSGSLASTYTATLPTREYVIYPVGTTVASGSFRYYADTPNSASVTSSAARRVIITETTSSSDIRVLYYVSGANNGPNGIHTGSRFLHGQDHQNLGSPVHSDASLQTTASVGFYAPLTHTISDGCFEIQTASFDNGGNDLGTIQMMVPRIKSKVTVSGT
jgi:hypothetical protein